MTDEATFTRAGIFNQHNEHYWAEENPRLAHEDSFQYEYKLNVWIGVLGENLLGPVFFPDNLNGAAFLEFLQNRLPVLLDAIPNIQDIRDRGMWFQLDGCPAHYYRAVREWLHENFSGM